MSRPQVLFVFTSADKTLVGGQTGYWLAEAAHPYYVLAPYVDIDFAAPKGANPPVDAISVKLAKDDASATKFLTDETVQAKLANAMTLDQVDPLRYDAVFYPGGHGPVIDLPFNALNAKIASTIFQNGKIVSAVCHGPAYVMRALVGATDADGNSIFKGRKSNAFTNVEEELFKGTTWVPFSVEDKIKELGGIWQFAEPQGVFVVRDGNLITGQNPYSATAVGEALLAALQSA
ncbi:ThiJ/PfpI [Auriculariales sp. MPI-PUGE-AT-0066]|nr:ThiJ/PfpI [Auriculariales sp. MPI-PUGE-AT-0066]